MKQFQSDHTTKHLHSGTFVLNCVMFMFRSGGLGNNVFFLSNSIIEEYLRKPAIPVL